MKKNITKEQVIETAVELMKNSDNLSTINLREIARRLGCAHTNLYNYFASYNDLLWATHSAIQEIFIEMMTDRINAANTAEKRFVSFFATFVDMYMDNKGWFRLAWQEYIEGDRPQSDIAATGEANKMVNDYISDIWNELYGEQPNRNKIERVLHNTHCYIVGEISNYLLGRGLIKDEQILRSYITDEAIRMFKLCLIGE